jgi:UDP-N-acetylglucosamine--N-acetylmuramyl-(pentapeptide) pyrophosphoryl-undecaprenol N-acetylglucosamine transferase
MKIVLTGSGSGGHVIPILSIIKKLKNFYPDAQIIFIGQKGDSLRQLIQTDKNISESYFIYAGKFRRYSNEGLKQLLDLSTILKNLRDIIFIIIGFLQSLLILKKVKPNKLFTRGGYISVPIALAAKVNKIEFLTHDSDVVPSLANKIIAPWAKYNLVALENGYYPYPKDKIRVVGVPVADDFQYVSSALQQKYRHQLKIKSSDQMLFVIGGGLGSTNINDLIYQIAPGLLRENSQLVIYHVVGHKNYDAMKQKYTKASYLSSKEQNRLHFFDFLENVYLYSGSADLIVSRAGATNIAEFAIQAKPCIVIPSRSLPNNHQIKNAEYLKEHQAAIVLNEQELAQDPSILKNQIQYLLSSLADRDNLSHNFHSLATNQAVEKIISYLV